MINGEVWDLFKFILLEIESRKQIAESYLFKYCTKYVDNIWHEQLQVRPRAYVLDDRINEIETRQLLAWWNLENIQEEHIQNQRFDIWKI